jgi:pimeloyl-ACP methyl ester carboxylesterase
MALAQKIALGYLRAKLNLLAAVSTRKAAEKALEIFSTPYRKVKKKVPPIFEKAVHIGFTMNRKKVHGYQWNHPSTHKFLILHGFESSAFNFDRYIKPMVKKGYEVVSMDAPAHGKSEGKTINLVQYIQMIEETFNRFGPFEAIMGHSFGGLAASLYLEKHPPKFRPHFVLIAPATETTTAMRTFFQVLQLNQAVQLEFQRQVEQRVGFKPAHFSISRVAPKLKAEMLWAHDEGDDMTPWQDAEKVQQMQLPHIRFFVTSGLGHRRIYRDNQVSKMVIDFFPDHAGHHKPGMA